MITEVAGARVADLFVALDRARPELPLLRIAVGEGDGGVGRVALKRPRFIQAIARSCGRRDSPRPHVAIGLAKLEAHLLGRGAGFGHKRAGAITGHRLG